MVQPIVKWLGGKRWLTPIVPAIRERLRGRYIEPFLGGAAMALALGEKGMILSDTCRPLIETYRQVRQDPEIVAVLLEALAAEGTDEESYYRVRDQFNILGTLEDLGDTREVWAAQFLYLNTLCYNGVFRLNKQEAFNVPYGKDPSRPMRTFEELQGFSQQVAQSTIIERDFRKALQGAEEGDVVYADCPYAKTFTMYTADGFGPDDQEDLAEALYRAHQRGVSIVTTNADQPEIRTLYCWARLVTFAEARSVSQNGAKRGRAACLIIASPGWEI